MTESPTNIVTEPVTTFLREPKTIPTPSEPYTQPSNFNPFSTPSPPQQPVPPVTASSLTVPSPTGKPLNVLPATYKAFSDYFTVITTDPYLPDIT